MIELRPYMQQKDSTSFYTEVEETANVLTHMIGIIFSIVSTILLWKTVEPDSFLSISQVGLYGISMILVYTISTIYHAARSYRLKQLFRRIDHASIYLLIAGTCTPFVLTTPTSFNLGLLAGIWATALSGFVFKLFFIDHWEGFSLSTYIAMGSIALIVISPFSNIEVTVEAYPLMILGGSFYLIGFFYFTRYNLPYNHAIWHVFSLAGSIFHYIAISQYILT